MKKPEEDEIKASNFEWLDRKWDMMFFELKKFKEKFGHCDVSLKLNNNPFYVLGQWCNHQRDRKKFLPLKYSPERENKLNEIGFSWSILDKRWEKKFTELVAFKEEFGHTQVPKTNKKFRALHLWVHRQRERRNSKDGNYEPDYVSRLNKIGFLWKPNDELFEKKFKELSDYYHKNGHCFVTKADNPKLSIWCSSMRRLKKGSDKSKQLTPERIQKLNTLKFEWNSTLKKVTLINEWNKKFEALISYKKKYGNFDANGYTELALYLWVYRQRKYYKNKNAKLTTHKINMLNSIGFNWVSNYTNSEFKTLKDADLLNELKRLNRLLGKTPGATDMIEHGNYSLSTYVNHFGNFKKALELAGLKQNSHNP